MSAPCRRGVSRDLELLTLPELAKEPRGVAALREASSALKPWKPPASAPALEHACARPECSA